MKSVLVIHERDLDDSEEAVIGVAESVEKAEFIISKYYGEYKQESFRDIRDSNLEYSKVISVESSLRKGEVWRYELTLEWFTLNDC